MENGKMLQLLTQLTFQYSPPVDAPYAPDSPPPGTRKDASNSTRLASEGNLDGDCLTAADDKFFEDYQDWVYQNPVTHLYGCTEEDSNTSVSDH